MQAHPTLKRIAEKVAAAENTEIGKPYMDLTLPDAAGEPTTLSGIVGNGRWVLLDFWATWCGPCCREIPHLREAYAACKSKGLEIYGVSLDNDAAKWKTFVADNDMPWINVLGVSADKRSDAAAMYGISSIPANFLISPEGIIVARDLRGENIKARLEEAMR
ncbi:MAG: peroxiredoxin family protein [Alistipes finegoldii]